MPVLGVGRRRTTKTRGRLSEWGSREKTEGGHPAVGVGENKE